MSRLLAALSLICAFFLVMPVFSATAAPRRLPQAAPVLTYCAKDQTYRPVCPGAAKRISGHASALAHQAGVHDPRPRAWCGWQMRQWLNVADRAGNRAIWWARYGANAHGPAVGVIVVWRHHVGRITGRTDQGWVVLSGNDGHAVRERVRSVAGAVAFRWPNQWASR